MFKEAVILLPLRVSTATGLRDLLAGFVELNEALAEGLAGAEPPQADAADELDECLAEETARDVALAREVIAEIDAALPLDASTPARGGSVS